MSQNKKAWYKRVWVWVIVAIVLIGVGGAMTGGKDNTATSIDTNASDSQSDKPEEKTEFKVGETATFDDKSITVTNVQRNYDTGNQFAQLC